MTAPADRGGSERAWPSRAAVELTAAVVVAVGAAMWLWQVNPLPHPSFDPSFARTVDCMQSGRCYTIGLPSTMVLVNGGVWQEFLIFVRLLGGAANLARTLIIALMAAGVGLIHLTTARLFHPAAAMAAAIFSVALLSTSDYAAQFIDTSLLFFLSTVAAMSLCLYALSGRLVVLAIAAAFTALAFNAHVAAVCLVPALLLLAGMAGRSPASAISIAVVIFFSATHITSALALATTADSLRNLQITPWVEVGIVLCLALGICLRPIYGRQSRLIKAAVLAAMLLAPWGTGLVIVARQQPLDGRYLQVVIAPIAVAAAVLLAQLAGLIGKGSTGRWAAFLLPTALSVCCFKTIAWPIPWSWDPVAAGAWTFDDGEKIGAWLGNRGWSYASLYMHLQGPRCRELLLGMAPSSPLGPAAGVSSMGRSRWSLGGAKSDRPLGTESKERTQVRVWLSGSGPPRALPHNAEMITLGGNRVAIVSPIDSWIDTSESLQCRDPLAAEAGAECWHPAAADALFEPATRAYRVMQEMLSQAPGAERSTYSIVIRPAAGESRDFSVSDSSGSTCTQIIAVEGIEADRPLPAAQVRLHSPGGAPARLAIRSLLSTSECPSRDERLPCLLESTPDEAELFPPRSADGTANHEVLRLPQVIAALTSDPWQERKEITAPPVAGSLLAPWVDRRRMLVGVVFLVVSVVAGFAYVLVTMLRAAGGPPRRA